MKTPHHLLLHSAQLEMESLMSFHPIGYLFVGDDRTVEWRRTNERLPLRRAYYYSPVTGLIYVGQH